MTAAFETGSSLSMYQQIDNLSYQYERNKRTDMNLLHMRELQHCWIYLLVFFLTKRWRNHSLIKSLRKVRDTQLFYLKLKWCERPRLKRKKKKVTKKKNFLSLWGLDLLNVETKQNNNNNRNQNILLNGVHLLNIGSLNRD